jgi:CRISPR/Cas system CSM-associated protein Csm2 small subunit
MDENNDYKKIREKKYKTDSKERLSKILRKKIQTTMIGALSSIEENLGFLWDDTKPNPKLTRAQMKELYNKIRSEILDKGNNQARNVDAELAQYEVEWLRYSIKIPVIQNPKN